VKECLETLACPAFYVDNGDIKINEHQCTGCMFCVQVCKDIKPRKRSA
jgi:indolepyruvate ferredoxin oxidoreductase alpha subunit